MPGFVAVQTFYMISGFYMALILNTKYSGPGSYKLFITNRFLRIYPAYWIVLILTIALHVLAGLMTGRSRFTAYSHPLTPGSWLFLLVTNVLRNGQDLASFLGLDPSGSLMWVANYQTTSPKVNSFLLVPQAWTLSLELMFYLVAPFLVRRSTAFITAVIAACLLLRLVYLRAAPGIPAWPGSTDSSRASWRLFLAGTLSYRLYNRLRERPLGRPLTATLGVAFLTITASFTVIPSGPLAGAGEVEMWGYYALACVLIPVLFVWTRNNAADRYIGELSYPLYISHMLVLTVLSNVLPRSGGETNPLLGLYTVVLGTVTAMALVHLLLEPIDRYRQSRVKASRAETERPHPPEARADEAVPVVRSGVETGL